MLIQKTTVLLALQLIVGCNEEPEPKKRKVIRSVSSDGKTVEADVTPMVGTNPLGSANASQTAAQLTSNVVGQMDYTHAGKRLIIGKDNFIGRANDNDDTEAWKSAVSRFSGKAFEGVLSLTEAESHFPDTYACAIAKLIGEDEGSSSTSSTSTGSDGGTVEDEPPFVGFKIPAADRSHCSSVTFSNDLKFDRSAVLTDPYSLETRRNLYMLMLASSSIYPANAQEPPAQYIRSVQEKFLTWGFLSARSNYTTDGAAVAALVFVEDFALIVFQGSASISSVMSNFEYNLVAGRAIGLPEKAMVHSGFFDSYKAIADGGNGVSGLRATLQEQKAVKHVLITGHSRGGALATLAGIDIAHNLPELKVDVVSFASPRVGNAAFASSIQNFKNLSLVRIENQSTDAFFDLVAGLPPTSVTLKDAKVQTFFDTVFQGLGVWMKQLPQ